MVKLQLLVAPHVTGAVHVQTNPKLSFSTAGTVAAAERKSCPPPPPPPLLPAVPRATCR